MVDTYAPDFATVSNGNNTTFDGSASSTSEAIIASAYGNFNAELYLEVSTDSGGTWTEVSQIDSVTADWHSQGNRIIVSATGSNQTRLRIDNIDSTSGQVSVDGDEL